MLLLLTIYLLKNKVVYLINKQCIEEIKSYIDFYDFVSAEIQTGYFKSGNYTWKEARNSCKLIGLFDKIKVSENDNRQYGWVDASVEYTPWVEYKSKYHQETF